MNLIHKHKKMKLIIQQWTKMLGNEVKVHSNVSESEKDNGDLTVLRLKGSICQFDN
jgi:hypothetical protein